MTDRAIKQMQKDIIACSIGNYKYVEWLSASDFDKQYRPAWQEIQQHRGSLSLLYNNLEIYEAVNWLCHSQIQLLAAELFEYRLHKYTIAILKEMLSKCVDPVKMKIISETLEDIESPENDYLATALYLHEYLTPHVDSQKLVALANYTEKRILKAKKVYNNVSK